MSDQSIHLQGIGLFQAVPAGDLKPGNRTVWNYGIIDVVRSVRRKGKSVYIKFEPTEGGRDWPERRFLATRLIGCERD